MMISKFESQMWVFAFILYLIKGKPTIVFNITLENGKGMLLGVK